MKAQFFLQLKGENAFFLIGDFWNELKIWKFNGSLLCDLSTSRLCVGIDCSMVKATLTYNARLLARGGYQRKKSTWPYFFLWHGNQAGWHS
ncbi:hypothetical protein NL676_004292 [Syzygium grande]|nr:hypothetical protein NL676_004292 [Syzygium grande]